MLNKTTITAMRALVHVGLARSDQPFSIRPMAEKLGESPTYLAKVTRLLVKAGILQAHRGVMGGIELNRLPSEITFLEIVEACQGTILPDFCRETKTLTGVCAFHVATAELHEAIVGVMSRWTLEQFLRRPTPTGGVSQEVTCILMPCVAQVIAAHGAGTSSRKRIKSSAGKK